MSGPSGKRGRGVPAAGWITALLGAGCLAAALPIAGAALSRLPGDAVLADLRAGAEPGSADLHRLAESRRRAADWRSDPRDAAARALAQIVLAERAGARGRDRLCAAERALNAVLADAPADPYAWTRLALVRWRLGRSSGAVTAALDAARRTGPHSARLYPVQRALTARLRERPDG
jgi:predicted Zn-dependent protease